jgi:glutathione S-transferase
VNCSDCRRSLHPYLDDELEVRDHVAILEHLDRCGPCRDVYGSEGRIRSRLKESLAKDRCPVRVAVAFAKSMRGERLRESWLRFLPAAAAVAATLVAAVAVRHAIVSDRQGPFDPWSIGVDAPPARLRYASRFSEPGRCPRTAHGPFVAWAEARHAWRCAQVNGSSFATTSRTRSS